MSKFKYPNRSAAILLIIASVVTVLATQHIGAQEEPQSPEADDFRIGVSDVLTISVWKNPELSAQVPVRPDGKIALPLVGEVEAAGLTPDQLRQGLNGQFASFVTAPTISVVVNVSILMGSATASST